MKTIVFCIAHMAHLNFFKQSVCILRKEGFDIKVCYLNRGKIRKVLEKEYPLVPFIRMGDYYKTKLGKVRMVLERTKLFLDYFKQEKPNYVTAVGDFVVAFTANILNIPNSIFYDDFEFKINYQLSRIFGDKLIVPFPLPKEKNVIKYKSFKELAYLHPEVFKPHIEPIKDLSLTKNNYVFAREVSGISLNYSKLGLHNLLKPIKFLYDNGYKVILSLEDKTQKEIYKPFCKILEEPVNDIYSIMKHALFCISSGDSMARESALLGVPSIYTGGRTMMVNKPLIKWGGIKKAEKFEEIKEIITFLCENDYKNKWSSLINQIIRDSLINTTKMIVNRIIKDLKN